MSRATGSGPRARLAFILAAAVLFAAVPPAASADDAVRVLALDDALRLAAERNRDIEKAREFRRQVEGRYVEERAAALPQLTITAGASRGADESQKGLSGGLLPFRQTAWSAEAALSQPLYTWGRVGAAIRAARMGFGGAAEQLRTARQAAARDVTAAFDDVLLAKELSGIASQNLQQKERHLDEARRRNAAGTATDYDVLAAEVAVANARPDVIRSEQLVRASRERLRFLLGIGAQEVDAQGTLEAPLAAPPGYAEALASAWKNRPELGELRNRVGIAEELVRIAAAGDKPRVDLKAGLGWKSVDTGTLSGEGAAWSVGLFATYPLFDGRRAGGAAAQARSEARTLRIEEARLLDAIALEVRNAVDAVARSAEIVRGLSGTAAQAARLLAMSEKGFEYGVKTRLEVEDAELNLRQALGSLASARRDYLVARVTLDYAMGVLPDGPPASVGEAKPWAPAANAPGIVREVLSGEPRLR